MENVTNNLKKLAKAKQNQKIIYKISKIKQRSRIIDE
jgi:hypothetical protein